MANGGCGGEAGAERGCVAATSRSAVRMPSNFGIILALGGGGLLRLVCSPAALRRPDPCLASAQHFRLHRDRPGVIKSG